MKTKYFLHDSVNQEGTQAVGYTIFLPLNHNNGRPVRQESLNKAQYEIALYAGGLTRYLPGRGTWVDRTAKVYKDMVVPFQVVVPPNPESTSWFTRWAAKMAIILEQEEIFVFSQPVWLLDSNNMNKF